MASDGKPTEISSVKMFDGYNKRYKHYSPTLGCSMTFHIYFPPSSSPSQKFPVSFFRLLASQFSSIVIFSAFFDHVDLNFGGIGCDLVGFLCDLSGNACFEGS